MSLILRICASYSELIVRKPPRNFGKRLRKNSFSKMALLHISVSLRKCKSRKNQDLSVKRRERKGLKAGGEMIAMPIAMPLKKTWQKMALHLLLLLLLQLIIYIHRKPSRNSPSSKSKILPSLSASRTTKRRNFITISTSRDGSGGTDFRLWIHLLHFHRL